MSTLGTILKDNWDWRSQIGKLAIFELQKESRGAALGWAWFFIQPAMYIFCFWFAIEIGLRAVRTAPGDAPYILWLMAGMMPWFFIQKVLGGGIDLLHRYSFLVNKLTFPHSAISTLYCTSKMLIQFMLQAILLAVYFLCGQPLDIHLLQVPFLLVLLFAFWDMFSIMVSQLCAMSKDVKKLMSTLSTPFFWLSGVIFKVHDIPVDWIQAILLFNPITFFVTAFRNALYDRTWVWEDPLACVCFAIVFVATLACMVRIYSRFDEEVADAL